MTPVVLSPLARQDLEDIWTYVAFGNVDAADHLLGVLGAAFLRLGQHPHLGRRRPDVTRRPLRFLPVGPRVIVYVEEADRILIVRVLSGYRDIAREFGAGVS